MRSCLVLFAVAGFCAAGLSADGLPHGETLRGTLHVPDHGSATVATADHRMIVLDGDETTRKVLGDRRLDGFSIEGKGHFTSPDRFLLDPSYLRSLLVRQDGKLKLITYFCDISDIRCVHSGTVRLLPAGNRARVARPGRQMSPQRSAYGAKRLMLDGVEVCVLEDAGRGMEVRVAPSIGNMAYQIDVHGRNILWFPYSSPAELREKPVFCGVPFLAPWANRLDGDAYWADGNRYMLNPGLGNLRRDPNGKPIHGLLNFSPLVEGGCTRSERGLGLASQPTGFLEVPGADGAVPFRAHGQDDVPAGGGVGGSGDHGAQSWLRSHAGCTRFSPLFPIARRRKGPLASARSRP